MANVTGSAAIPIRFGVGLANPFLSDPNAISFPLAMLFASSGVAAEQCDRIYANTLALAAAPQTIDLTSFTDVFGTAGQSMARVRFVAWRNRSTTNGQVVTLGANATSPWAGLAVGGAGIYCYPSTVLGTNDGFAAFCMPNTTAAAVNGTSKIIKVDPGANTMLFDLLIAGAST